METVLADGAQHMMSLPATVQQLHLNGVSETLLLRTVWRDLTHFWGSNVCYEISPECNPEKHYKVQGAFTTDLPSADTPKMVSLLCVPLF